MNEIIDQIEEKDGVRFSWNIWPSTKAEAAKVVIPIACLYTPNKQSPNIPIVQYEPVMCAGCRIILNPFCEVDFVGKLWTCPFCYRKNHTPPHYAVMTETKLPPELIPNYTTIEYVLPRAAVFPPVFLFVVDTCMIESDLSPLKETLLMGLNLIPKNSLVGLITFGSTVQVHELGFQSCPKAYVFNGSKEIPTAKIQSLLGFSKVGANVQPSSRFLVELNNCEEILENILEELQPDPLPLSKGDSRPKRCTGVALSVAIALLENTVPNSAARIMTFISGPCTEGPGAVIGESVKEFIRAHHDISTGNAKYVEKATKYYDDLAVIAAKNGHAVDVFGSSLDQVGLLEMRTLLQKTGGVAVLADNFENEMFTASFRKVFEKNDHGNLKMSFNAALEVITCKELKICGSIGHCSSIGKKSPNVSESVVGVGGTSAWRICTLDPNSTFAFYFEVANQTPLPKNQKGCIQFHTHYQNSAGQRVLRVTTVSHFWADPNQGNAPLASGFDQEAAAVLMARFSAYKAESQDTRDILRWLDRSLIRLCSRFAEYRKGESSSFTLGASFALYPQFMYHLRRSDLLQVFNNSPDETCFKRLLANRETVGNCLMMIQPTLEAYKLFEQPFPVLLSATSIQSDRVLVLDTFFHVVVWYGEQIASWRNQGFADKPEYAHLKTLLGAPKAYIDLVRKERFPLPRFIESDEGKSQARFLTARVDPATSRQFGTVGSETIATEDVKFEVFLEHLKNLSVQQQQ